MDETKALEAFARMMNTSGADEFLQLIDKDFVYSSQTWYKVRILYEKILAIDPTDQIALNNLDLIKIIT
jgi:hypothetical protein